MKSFFQKHRDKNFIFKGDENEEPIQIVETGDEYLGYRWGNPSLIHYVPYSQIESVTWDENRSIMMIDF